MKKSLLLLMASCFLCAVITGCRGGVVTQNIAPSPTPNVKYYACENPVVIPCLRKVAIFPFADYSHQQEYMGVDAWGGNIKIQEEITDHLVAHGISVTVQEDVNTILVDHDIIRPIDKNKYLLYGTLDEQEEKHNKIGTPEHELANYKHSRDMQREIMRVIKRENRKKKTAVSKSPVLQGSTVGLTKEKVVELAQALDVDLIIRGRILDYGFKDVGTLNPLYRGFVPVVIDSAKDLLFGATPAYGYDDEGEDIENMLVGAALGYAIGNNIIDRSTSSSSRITGGLISRRVTSTDVDHDDNAVEGAAVGAAAGWLASQHPKKAKRSAVVQVRLYAQDGVTGDVLWSNRVEIEYTPNSNFAYSDTHPKVMFDKAVKEGIQSLMDSFFTEAKSVLTEKSAPAMVQNEGA